MNKSAFKLLSFNYFLDKYFKNNSDIIILNTEPDQYSDIPDLRVTFLEQNILNNSNKDWLDDSYYQTINFSLNSRSNYENNLIGFLYLN